MAPEPAGSGAPVGFYRHRIVASPDAFLRREATDAISAKSQTVSSNPLLDHVGTLVIKQHNGRLVSATSQYLRDQVYAPFYR
jgi:hypothetical protein